MKTLIERSLFVIAIALIVLSTTFSAGFAKNETPETFLNSIYDHYRGEDEEKANGVMLDTDADLHRYFTPSTAKLIIDDNERASKAGEVPALDGDPFVDAQEWKIDSFDIVVRHTGPESANATVTFTNYNAQKKVLLSLTRLKEGWRIEDIVWNGNEGTLRGLYEKKKTSNQ